MSVAGPSHAELAALEHRVDDALARGAEHELPLLGYGEISCVVALDGAAGRFACKRLPRFDSTERFTTYAALFERYLAELTAVGVVPIASTLHPLPQPDGGVVAYCVQPRLGPEQLAPNVLGRSTTADGELLLGQIFALVAGAVSPRLGLDAQLSNWCLVDGELRYLDVTTPFLRDERGRDLLDRGLFVASLPWALRGLVSRFVAPAIIAEYHDVAATLLDLVGNLHKEKLDAWIGPALARLHDAGLPAPSPNQVAAFYKKNARMYAVIQRLRRLDRAWQRGVRRRKYPFVLPGRIER